MIEKMTKILYYQCRDYINAPMLNEILLLTDTQNEIRNYEHKSLYLTLLLNLIFRHPEINKRVDVIAHKMGITEGFWLMLKYPTMECHCHFCSEGAILNDVEKYNRELNTRNLNRCIEMTFYCPFRTFRVQDSILTSPAEEINLSVYRLFRVKSEKGFLEYRLLDNPPLDCSPPKEVTFNLSCGLLPMKYERHIKRQDRVGQIKYAIAKDLKIDLSEYQICL
jgi:hypothetical protein